jgi:molybdopterin-binding protein
MNSYRLGDAARILGVSVDTVRRHADAGRLGSKRTAGQHRRIDGKTLARLADRIADEEAQNQFSSARNHLLGIVTRVVRDKVAAQVELRCGPFRIVSLVTRESVDSLGLEPGVMACAVVKATNVVVELAPAAMATATNVAPPARPKPRPTPRRSRR